MPDRRARLALLAVAVCAGLVVLVVASDLFTHFSSNHDEGVYLQQAAMLLEGRLFLRPAVPDAVHPWFFVQDGDLLYPKYTPVPAAVFALGLSLGVPQLSLALVAAGNTALVGLLATDATDGWTGVLAAALFAAAPLALVDSSVFLPYAPTTLFNLLFAVGYVRACRAATAPRRRRYALLAGAAVGIAFFARPYTAVLFAAPFVTHAGLVSLRALRTALAAGGLGSLDRAVVERYGIVTALGTAGVAVSLAYNWVVTGDPLVYPYQAFAPADGPGFGVRRILGYEREYTPALALRANATVLWRLFTRWTVAGPLGTLAAVLGLGVAARRLHRTGTPWLSTTDGLSVHGVRTLLAGLFVSIPVGNVFFWGNLNILASLSVPDDGLISLLGPFYHFDLLVPLAVFGAVGTVTAVRWTQRTAADLSGPRGGRVAAVVVIIALLATGAVAQAVVLSGPVDRNRQYTDRYDRAYEPFADTDFERALVFVPTPYGEWLNHPFQRLRNDPGFDGPAVYALDRGPAEDIAVMEAYPDRRPYRYTYRGQWTPTIAAVDQRVQATLEPLRLTRGEAHRLTVDVGRIAGSESATVRLAGPEGAVQYGFPALSGDRQTVNWTVTDGRARVTSEDLIRYSDQRFIRFEEPTDLTLTVTYTQAGGSTVSYRQTVTATPDGDGVAVVWPAEQSVCELVTECGTEGTYLPEAEGYPAGTAFGQALETGNGTA